MPRGLKWARRGSQGSEEGVVGTPAPGRAGAREHRGAHERVSEAQHRSGVEEFGVSRPFLTFGPDAEQFGRAPRQLVVLTGGTSNEQEELLNTAGQRPHTLGEE